MSDSAAPTDPRAPDQQRVPPIHPAGWPFIAIAALVTVGLWWVWVPAGVFGTAVTAWCVWFFRDPPRHVPVGDRLVVSPADGVVQAIVPDTPPAELEAEAGLYTRISVFMNVFDVHVNRMPLTGRVRRLSYRPGRFFNASFEKASVHNERQGILLESDGGRTFAVVQIAGLVARRILCRLKEGQHVSRGERFGMIRFGSRVDVYVPAGVTPRVNVGERAVAGMTVLAELDTAPEGSSPDGR